MDALEGIRIESALAAAAEREAEDDEVGQTDFLQMLVAQLENQDPLNPQDSAAFAAQLAQFSSVEQLIAMRAGIDTLVAASQDSDAPESTPDATASLDAASLVGREVVVFGGQIEVDEAQSVVRLPIRTAEAAAEASVSVYDQSGRLVHQASILPLDGNGRPVSLRPGDHTWAFDPAAHNLRPGIYAVEFSAADRAGEALTVLPMETGVVTGAILAGEPSIRLGGKIVPITEILEVRLAPGEGPSTTNDPTGGAQTVRRPEPVAGPTGGAS